MAANSLGGLVVTLGLDAAEYFSGFTKAEYQARQSAEKIQKSIDGIKTAFIGLGASLAGGFTVSAFTDMVSGAIKAQEELQLVGERAGLTGSELSKLTTAAKLSHTAIEDVATMSAKLSKALIEGQDGTSKQAKVLAALGITAKDTARLLADPTQAVFELAKRINELPEGGTKAAAQLLILGKAGGTTSAFLRELSTQTELVAKRTQDEIDAAVELEHSLTRLGILTDGIKTTFANALVGPLTDAVKVFADATGGADGLGGAIKRLVADGSIKEWAQDALIALATLGESLGVVAKSVLALGGSVAVVAADLALLNAASNAPKGKITGSFGFSPEEAERGNAAYDAVLKHRNETLERANKRYSDLWNDNATVISDGLKKQFAAAKNVEPIGNADRAVTRIQDDIARKKEADKRVRDAVKDSGGGVIDDPSRKILQAALEALKAASAEEKAIMNSRENYLAASFAAGNLSIAEYYTSKQAAQDQDLQATTRNYLSEIALIDTFIKNAKTKTEAAQGEKEKVAATARQRLAIIVAGDAANKTISDNVRALKEFGLQVDEVNAKLLDLESNTAGATAIRTKNATADFREAAVKQGRPDVSANIDRINAAAVAQAKINDATKTYALTLDELGVAQAHVDNLIASGSVSSLAGLRLKTDATASYVEQLTAELAVAEKLAAESGRREDIIHVQQLKVALEGLRLQGDLVAKTFQDALGTSFADNLTAVLDRTKSLSDGFKSLEKDILHMINSAIAAEAKSYLFGGGGSLSGAGGGIASLLGLGGNSGGINGGAIGDAYIKMFGAAGGVNDWRGGPLMVGEHGPEVVNLPRGASVTPNSELTARRNARDMSVTINQSFSGSTSSASMTQAAVAARVELERAHRNL